MVQEHGIHGLAYIVVASERKRQVAYTAAYMHMRQVLANPFYRTYEIQGITVVLRHTGSYRKDVGVENNILGRESGLFGKEFVCPAAYLYFTLIGNGLSYLVESHYNHSRAETSQFTRMRKEFILSFL